MSASNSLERRGILRILDANLNRATEGLRVVEEYCRFVRANSLVSYQCKELRHDLIRAFDHLDFRELLNARDTPGDVGTTIASFTGRTSIEDVVRANAKRIEQALRTLEEYGHLVDPNLSSAVTVLRYRAYELEKQVMQVIDVCPPLLEASRLNVLIDGCEDTEAFVKQVSLLIADGVTMIQLRDKQLCDSELLERARALRSICESQRCLFIMNDRPDLAALASADGVHVGQEELSVADARKIVGPRALVGVSTHTIEQARQAVLDGADYIGCGPTFASSTKTFDHFPGVDFLREVDAEIRLPAFAIGGITLDNLAQVKASGVNRVAVSCAITAARDPAAATRAFLEQLR